MSNLEMIIVDESQRNPSLIGLVIKGVYNDRRGWKSITFQKGESLINTVKHLRRLADLIEDEI